MKLTTSGIIISDYAKGVCSNELVKNIIQFSDAIINQLM